MFKNLKAKSLKKGYVWQKNGFTVSWNGNGYYLAYYGGGEVLGTLAEIKTAIREGR